MFGKLSVLREGCQYLLDGERIEYFKKEGNLYCFYGYEYNQEELDYIPTGEILYYFEEELQYIKRVQSSQPKGVLKQMGKDKVFPKI